MRISDWSSDVCSSDLVAPVVERQALPRHPVAPAAVAMGVMPSQEAESLLRRRQRAVERIEQRRLAEGIDLAGLHHDPLAVVAGWAPRKIERLMADRKRLV